MATHTYCYGLAQCCVPPLFFLPWTSTDGLLSSLLVLGVCCGLAGLQTTIGNCPVFPLPNSKPPNSQQLHSLPRLPTFPLCLSTILSRLLFFQYWQTSRLDSSVASESASRQYKEIKPMSVLWFLFKRWRNKQNDISRGVYSNWLSSYSLSNKSHARYTNTARLDKYR